LEICPTQAIQICSIRWIALDRFLSEAQRLIELDATVCEHIPEIIQDCWIVFLQLQSLTESLFSFADLILFLVQRTLEEIDLPLFRKTLYGRIQYILSVAVLFSALINVGHRRKNVEVVLILLRYFLQRPNAFLYPAFFGDQVRTYHLKLPVIGCRVQRLFAVLERLIQILSGSIRLYDHQIEPSVLC